MDGDTSQSSSSDSSVCRLGLPSVLGLEDGDQEDAAAPKAGSKSLAAKDTGPGSLALFLPPPAVGVGQPDIAPTNSGWSAPLAEDASSASIALARRGRAAHRRPAG
mmetsp:Transcript_115109/g.289649  ORF Transcript_115109/g.289649 Transcript_115109/m.289649 type:complete len:106 (+) Transcript_115109:2322-2639(+)